MRTLVALASVIPGGLAATTAMAAAAPCDAMAGWDNPRAAHRQITTLDLARLRDIGRSDTGTDQAPAASISPDGRLLAFVVRRADPARDRYCQTLVLLRRDGSGEVSHVPLPGQPRRFAFDLRGLWMPLGMFAVASPRWAPDGKKLAILVSIDADPRAIIVDAQGRRKAEKIALPRDVIDIAWRRDGAALIYSMYSDLAARRTAARAEARLGYHYDRRVWPTTAAAPLLQAPKATEVRSRSLFKGADRLATADERLRLAPAGMSPPGTATGATLKDGTSAWVEPVQPTRWGSLSHVVRRESARQTICADEACTGRVTSIWPDEPSQGFVFLRREGWGGSTSVLYRWRPGSAPKRILATDDLLLGCQSDRGALLCELESSLRPRRLVSIETATGAMHTVFDPNPEFRSFVMPRVTRLHWKADLGVEGFGDLVVPASALPDRPLPLVVVGYRTRGFLRGAIGDEFPILPFAARGFAVLSLENTPEYATVINAPVATYDEAAPIDFRGEADRRLILSSLKAGLAMAATRAEVDQARVAITGLSDAASTAWFALINTKLFSLASISTPTFDPKTAMSLAGPALQEELRRWGYPRPLDPDVAFWQALSPALNAGRIAAPMLLQYSDDEYLMGLEAYTAFRERDRAVDLYVFPGEHHIKWQAAHRLAVYDRNVDWFTFWFQHVEDPDPHKSGQYVRWRKIRDEACQARASPAPDTSAPIAAQLCNQASTSTNIATRK